MITSSVQVRRLHADTLGCLPRTASINIRYNLGRRNMASVAPAPVESIAQPATNPAIQQATGGKKGKDKKAANAGGVQLEVR